MRGESDNMVRRVLGSSSPFDRYRFGLMSIERPSPVECAPLLLVKNLENQDAL